MEIGRNSNSKQKWREWHKEMEMVNFEDRKAMPIPQKPLPKKIIGFKRINILYIDRKVITFLRHFRQIFATRPINLTIITHNDCILEFILHNIWPLLGENIHGLQLSAVIFHHFRQFAPSILNDYPSLRIFSIYYNYFYTKFPADDSAMALDGQAVAKWLFTPLQNNVPKMFNCCLHNNDLNLSSKIEAFKAAFASASSPVNFIIMFWFLRSNSVVPFDLTNELTQEQMVFKMTNYRLLLVRCPIARDESKWTKWEEEAIGCEIEELWNKIDIQIYSPSDQQLKRMNEMLRSDRSI
ncbi:hypothetical protein niasHT_023692 [Heterodera trifolii]|uniref:Uncharacterized protein n=1 Tax=Heterodera trifolii TaxID=157864 RepID=A0ABD2JA59_9BILA